GKAPRAGRQLAVPQLRASTALLAGAKPSRRGKLPGISRHAGCTPTDLTFPYPPQAASGVETGSGARESGA
ncbi:hypothetical protein AB0J11_46555, partial [Streptomyces hokutonensis]